ncbi:uncharacterized protein LOC143296877 isoform X13 [Babylonia areolata]|uniref:uncharacterized protein LOC143296877 isoform X13 n=1 Tax=Babylonia areolata TaxID=304850 RepID=UPI003FCFE64E
MEKLGDESAAKFINALIKSVQTLCHGYLDFQNGVEIIGHINLSVDKGNSLDYILKEKVCKNAENSTLFISNSFHAEPKPEQEVSGKTSQSGNQLTQNSESPDTAESGRVSSAICSISTALTESRERSRRNSGAKDSGSSHSQPNAVKRKASEEESSEFRPAKISYHDNFSHVTSESSHPQGSSSPVDSKESLLALRTADTDMSETVLPQTASVRSDGLDIGVNLAGSVLEPVEGQNNPDLQDREDDSDGDLEVTFIKEEYVEGEGPSCDFESQQFARGPQQRASDGLPDPSIFSLGPQSSSASSTYVPSAAGPQFPVGTSSSTSQPQPGPSGMRDSMWTTESRTVRENRFDGTTPCSLARFKANFWSSKDTNVQMDSQLAVRRAKASSQTSASIPFAYSCAFGAEKFSQWPPEAESSFQKRLFRCPMCEYKNSRMYNLKRHMRCHTGQKFQCGFCAAEYNCKYKLHQHQLLKHQLLKHNWSSQ